MIHKHFFTNNNTVSTNMEKLCVIINKVEHVDELRNSIAFTVHDRSRDVLLRAADLRSDVVISVWKLLVRADLGSVGNSDCIY